VTGSKFCSENLSIFGAITQNSVRIVT